MKKQKINLVVLKMLMHKGILPNPVGLLDLEVLFFLINRGECSLEGVLGLSDENIELWRRNFLQIKIAVSDSDNLYFTGIEVHHNPRPEEAVVHFAKNGGAEDFRICYEKE